MKIICIDFDGVLHSYCSGWKGVDVIPDPPVQDALEWLDSLIADPELKPVIYSSRSKSPLGVRAMKNWLKKYGFKNVDQLDFPSQKPPAYLTIDDRAICFSGEFPSLIAIKRFTPWNKVKKEDTPPNLLGDVCEPVSGDLKNTVQTLFEKCEPVLKDKFAEYAHEAWAGWMNYLFSKSYLDDKGNAIIPKEFVDRWFRQIHTLYKDLPEKEKESDRAEAMAMLQILRRSIRYLKTPST